MNPIRRLLLVIVIWSSLAPLALVAARPTPAEAQIPLLPAVVTCAVSTFCLAAVALGAAALGVGGFIADDDNVSLLGLYEELRSALPDWAQHGIVQAVQAGQQSFDVTTFDGYDAIELEAALSAFYLSGITVVSPTGTWAGTEATTLRVPARPTTIGTLLAHVNITVPCDNFASNGAVCGAGSINADRMDVRWGEFNMEDDGDGVHVTVLNHDGTCQNGSLPICDGTPRDETGIEGTGTMAYTGSTRSTGNRQFAVGDDYTNRTFRVNVYLRTGVSDATWESVGHKWQLPNLEWALKRNSPAATSQYYVAPVLTQWVLDTELGAVIVGPSPGHHEGPVAIPRAGTDLTGVGPGAGTVVTPNGDTVTLVDPVPATGAGSDTAAVVGVLGSIYGVLTSILGAVGGLGAFISEFPDVLGNALSTALPEALEAAFVPTVGLQARVETLTAEFDGRAPFAYVGAAAAAWGFLDAYGAECPYLAIPIPAWDFDGIELCMSAEMLAITQWGSRFVAAGLFGLWGFAMYRRLVE